MRGSRSATATADVERVFAMLRWLRRLLDQRRDASGATAAGSLDQRLRDADAVQLAQLNDASGVQPESTDVRTVQPAADLGLASTEIRRAARAQVPSRARKRR